MSGTAAPTLLARIHGSGPPQASPRTPRRDGQQENAARRGGGPRGRPNSRLLVASAGAHAAALAAFLLLQWGAPAPPVGPVPVEMRFAPPSAGPHQQVDEQAGDGAKAMPVAPPVASDEPAARPDAVVADPVAETAPPDSQATAAPVDAPAALPPQAELAEPSTVPLPAARALPPTAPPPPAVAREAVKASPVPQPRREPKAARPAQAALPTKGAEGAQTGVAPAWPGAPSPAGPAAAPAAMAPPPLRAADTSPVQIVNPRFRLPPKPPAYPQLAREQGQEGEAVIRARLDREGNPEEVLLAASSGFPVLDRAALAAVRRWVFEPGRRGGEPVAAWVQVPVRFALR